MRTLDRGETAQRPFSPSQAAVAKDVPTVLVLVNGGILSIENLLAAAPPTFAVVEAFNPQGRGGPAGLAALLFGRENRWGKLPVTIYAADICNYTSITDMSFQNRSYRYYDGTPLFEFGSGLSYTEFEMSCGCDLGDRGDDADDYPARGAAAASWVPTLTETPAKRPTPETRSGLRVRRGDALRCGCHVRNVGARAGDEVVLAYFAVWIFRRRVAATPRLRRGYSVETGRGDAAAATWTFRGDRRRRGRSMETGGDVDVPWRPARASGTIVCRRRSANGPRRHIRCRSSALSISNASARSRPAQRHKSTSVSRLPRSRP